nr:hypothetical protein BaRGS_010214 [Batillaria attramentaria]
MGPGVWYTKKFGTQPDKEVVHNLLTNPSFEEDLRGTWFSYGFDMVQYAKDAIHMRKSQNHGPTQELQGLVTGGRYAFQAKVKLLNENAVTVWQRFKATVAFQFSTQRKRKARSTDEEETGYIIAYRGFVTKEQGWVNLEGNINAPMKEFTGARLTIRGPEEGIDFLVDDAILWEVPEHPNWEAQARDNIERFRKSNIRFRAWNVVLDAGFLRVCPIQPHVLRRICLATGSWYTYLAILVVFLPGNG